MMKLPSTAKLAASPFERRVDAAEGFLELGLPLEAHEELDGIEPGFRHHSEVLVIRLAIYRRLRQWALVEATARILYQRDPFDPGYILAMAEAIRHDKDLPAAIALLVEGVGRVSDCAALVYQLAAYEARDGRVEAARAHLAKAIDFVPEYREMAREDERLRPLLEE